MQYANIKSRCAAFIIDLLLLWPLSFLGIKLLHFILAMFSEPSTRNPELIYQLAWGSFLINIIVMIIFLGLFEGFLLPASIGKMILKLRVVTIDGSHIRAGNATVRWLYKMAPYIITIYIGEHVALGKFEALRNHQDFKSSDFLPAQLIGTALVLFSIATMILASRNKQKQALHDKMAKTVVIKTNELGLFQIIWHKAHQCFKFLRRAGQPD